MFLKPDKGNHFLERFVANPDLIANGVKAELIGRHNIKLSRGGRPLGIWRQAVGSYQWFPAGHNHPQTTVVTIEDAVRHLSRSLRAH